jgi:hypothetical protein
MNTRTIVTTLVVGALVATPAIALAQQSGNRTGNEAQQRAQVERVQRDIDRDRLRDRDRISEPAQDRDRIQDRTNAPEDAKQAENRVYGYELMTEPERLAYQERLQNAATEQDREQIKAQHREEIQVRARNRNIQLDEAGNPVGEE